MKSCLQKTLVCLIALMSFIMLFFTLSHADYFYGGKYANAFNIHTLHSTWDVLLRIFGIIQIIIALICCVMAIYRLAAKRKDLNVKIIVVAILLSAFYMIEGLIMTAVWRSYLRSVYTYAYIPFVIICLLSILYWIIHFLPADETEEYETIKEKNRIEIKAEKLKQCVFNSIKGVGYLSLISHVLLNTFTLGIWDFVWTYRTTSVLNSAPKTRYCSPVNKLLLCIFVPFYRVYWFYVQGVRLDKMISQKEERMSGVTGVCVLLGLFIPFVATTIMQAEINELAMIPTEKD